LAVVGRVGLFRLSLLGLFGLFREELVHCWEDMVAMFGECGRCFRS
jgi:hypothetical protein